MRDLIKINRAIVILLMATLIAFTYSCKKESVEKSSYLEFAENESTVGFAAGASSNFVKVNTNAEELTLSNSAEWCIAEFDKIRSIITITVSDNVALEGRTASIVVENVSPQQTLTVKQFGVEPAIILDSRLMKIDYKAQRVSMDVLSNIDLNTEYTAAWIKEVTDLKTVRIDPVKFSFSFDIEAMSANDARQGIIYLKHQEGDFKDSVVLVQSIVTSDYQPGDIQSFESDKKIKVFSSELSPADMFQSSEPLSNAIDGDLETIYHSPWNGMTPNTPIAMTFHLESDVNILNYIVLHPRSEGLNGVIKSGTIEVKTASQPNFVQVAEFNFSPNNVSQYVMFPTPVVDPVAIRVNVTDAYSASDDYFVSLAEFECYESRSLTSLQNDLNYFTDQTFSELAPGVTIQDIPNIENPFIKNIATYLMAGNYPIEYRVQDYEPYRDVFDLADELKNSPYNQYENPTGVYFEKDENVIVFLGETQGQKVFLRVRDFGPSGEDHSYNLKEGVNIISMRGKGNGYFSYYTKDDRSAPTIKAHIASGQINGFFDATRHSNEEGVKLLDNAVSEILDLRGEYVQMAYTVNALKNYSYEHLKDLVTVYDSMVSHQFNILGLRKYNRLPKNRILARTTWNGYMYKDSYGAAFHEDQMQYMAHYDKIKDNAWGPAHEFGHVNQVQNGMMWVGTAEVTNNIFSTYTQWKLTPDNLRLEQENTGGEIGGRLNAYLKSALLDNQEWGIQAGPDRAYGLQDGKWGGDVFVSLSPMWQLTLFFKIAGEGTAWYKPDFWGDIFEMVRNTDETGVSHGQLQINFVKNACDAAQLDLSEFFTKTGFLKEVDKFCGDYTSRQKTITTSMIQDAIDHASQYPKPASPVIYYISGNNYKAFQEQQAVEGTYNYGIGINGTVRKIEHSSWKNVAVFETYQGETLTQITMAGTGDSSGQEFTNVSYPDGSTRIEAVGFDGNKVLVYGNR